MWNKIEEEQPKHNGIYPVWVIANHSGHGFWHPCSWYGGKFVIEGTLNSPESYGWTLIAWFDLPSYEGIGR